MVVKAILAGGIERTYEHIDAVRYITPGVELMNHARGVDNPRPVALLHWANLMALETPEHDSAIDLARTVQIGL